MRFGRLVTNHVHVLPLLESLYDGRENGKELRTANLDSIVSHTIRVSFDVLPIEAGDFYIHQHTKPTAFHVLNFYQFEYQLLQQLHYLHE